MLVAAQSAQGVAVSQGVAAAVTAMDDARLADGAECQKAWCD
jgi:hypothetical protein